MPTPRSIRKRACPTERPSTTQLMSGDTWTFVTCDVLDHKKRKCNDRRAIASNHASPELWDVGQPALHSVRSEAVNARMDHDKYRLTVGLGVGKDAKGNVR